MSMIKICLNVFSWFTFKVIHAGRMNSEAWVVSRNYIWDLMNWLKITGSVLFMQLYPFLAVRRNTS